MGVQYFLMSECTKLRECHLLFIIMYKRSESMQCEKPSLMCMIFSVKEEDSSSQYLVLSSAVGWSHSGLTKQFTILDSFLGWDLTALGAADRKGLLVYNTFQHRLGCAPEYFSTVTVLQYKFCLPCSKSAIFTHCCQTALNIFSMSILPTHFQKSSTPLFWLGCAFNFTVLCTVKSSF